MKKAILSVVGARPNFLKLAPLHQEFSKHATRIKSVTVHTGQHYDFSLSDAFFQDLELPEPDHYLEVGSASHSVQTAKVMMQFGEVIQRDRPDWVIVFGDVNSTLACALVCAKERIPLAHVEAGLRSFDRSMPEEVNRLLTDQVSDLLFVTEAAAVQNLRREGISEDKIHLTGSIMIDALVQFQEKVQFSAVLTRLGVKPKTFFVMTMHRAGNVDSAEKMKQLVELVEQISRKATIVFPLHPRTSRNLKEFSLLEKLQSLPNVHLTEPFRYLDFLCLVKYSLGVLSDSGGIQAETTFLNVPCLTLREETEQPVTIERGTNELVGFDSELIMQRLEDICCGRAKQSRPIPYWDGKTAERITRILLES
jgi:UDP-N-acetylglucosamine 2-epimerase (non-hydrolysing)